MKANELRLNNLFLREEMDMYGAPRYEVRRITPGDIADAAKYGDDWNGEAIPLTEDWLKRFGFEGNRGFRYWLYLITGRVETDYPNRSSRQILR